jgi:hypothetical protein
LVVLAVGIVAAIILFTVEIVYHKVKYGIFWPSNLNEPQPMDVKYHLPLPLTFHRQWQN